jgi:hypothetical protein
VTLYYDKEWEESREREDEALDSAYQKLEGSDYSVFLRVRKERDAERAEVERLRAEFEKMEGLKEQVRDWWHEERARAEQMTALARRVVDVADDAKGCVKILLASASWVRPEFGEQIDKWQAVVDETRAALREAREAGVMEGEG